MQIELNVIEKHLKEKIKELEDFKGQCDDDIYVFYWNGQIRFANEILELIEKLKPKDDGKVRVFLDDQILTISTPE